MSNQNRVAIHNHQIVSELPEVGDRVTANLGFRTDVGIWMGLEDGYYRIATQNGGESRFTLSSVFRMLVWEPQTVSEHVLKAARVDHANHEMPTWMALTGRTYRDDLGALWVELHVEGAGSFWYTTERDDLADIMWFTASMETIEEIPQTRQS